MKTRKIEKVAYTVLAGTLLIHGFLFWKDRSLIVKGYPDFTIFYSAGLIVRQGLGHQLYDDALQYRSQRSFAPGVIIRQGNLPYNHLPFEALIFVPLTFLPYPAAYFTWNLLNIGMLVLVPRLLRPHIAVLKRKPTTVWVLALLAFFPVSFALLQGQDVILLLLLQSLAFAALERDSDFLSGCYFGLGSFKYHLMLPVVLVIWLGWKRSNVLLGFLAVCVCLGAVSVAIVGWNSAEHYPAYVLHLEKVMGHGAILPASMPNVRGLLEGWHSAHGLTNLQRDVAIAASFVLFLWATVTSIKKSLGQKGLLFAAATTVGVLISYHSLAYDLVVLIIPCVLVINLLVGDFQMRRDTCLWLPVALLWCTPLYAVLSLWTLHMNLYAVILIVWLWGIQGRISESANPCSDGSLAT